MKKLLFFFAVAATFASCCNQNTNKNTAVNGDSIAVQAITVDSFLIVAADFVGKEITISGTVDHVCKHGGKQVKIFSSCPSKFIFAKAGETIGSFRAELTGSDAYFTGTVLETRMDLAYVDEWEKTITESADNTTGDDHKATPEKIKDLREKINASEKGYISTYAIEVNKYQEYKTANSTNCSDSTVIKDTVSKACGGQTEVAPCGSKTEAAPCGEKKEGSGCCGGKK